MLNSIIEINKFKVLKIVGNILEFDPETEMVKNLIGNISSASLFIFLNFRFF